MTAYSRTGVFLSVLPRRSYPVNALSHKERSHVAGLSYGSLVALQLSLFTLQFFLRRSSVVLPSFFSRSTVVLPSFFRRSSVVLTLKSTSFSTARRKLRLLY